MRPDATFTFAKLDGSTRYELARHLGEDVPEFPAVWKRGRDKAGRPKAGRAYVTFRPRQSPDRPGHRNFGHVMEGEDARTYTGFDFGPEHPRRVYGDFNGYAMLIEFSEGFDGITVMFFRGRKAEAQSLFQRWLDGEPCETAEAETLHAA